MKRTRTAAPASMEVFYKRIQPRIHIDENGCWLWQGCITKGGVRKGGYGWFGAGGVQHVVHRYVYAAFNGPIADGLVCDHTCRVRHCCNPEHIEMVTNQQNILRGISPPAIHIKKTHCPSGHPLSGENLYLPPDGTGRECRRCRYERNLRIQQRRKAEMA